MESLDYKFLCQTLFGTSDADELAQIAGALQQKNPRHAGRKQKFTEADVAEMRKLQKAGVSITAIAARYQASRQTIGKYINTPPEPGYPLRLTLMYQCQPCTTIDVDLTHQRILVQNKTDNIPHCAFGSKADPTWEDFLLFLQSRCRFNPDTTEKPSQGGPKLQVYQLLQILENTRGRIPNDDLWLRFQYLEEVFQEK